MKIVVIDGFTLNPGDLSWEGITELGETVIYDRTRVGKVIERCADAEVILTNKVPFDAATLTKLPKLKLICVTATGYNIIDVKKAEEMGIAVCNVPDYGTDSVAQHTFALILELCNKVSIHAASVKEGRWVQSPDFSYSLGRLMELRGKTIGLVGFGSIGKQTAVIANAFGMKVLYYTPKKKDTDLAEYADLKTLFSESDIVSLHLPLKEDNREFVNKQLLSTMKKTAFLVNTARGQHIREQDLAAALDSGQIAGAALDVLSEEPPRDDNPLLKVKNCVITPHNAWMTLEARQRIMDITIANLKAFEKGEPANTVR